MPTWRAYPQSAYRKGGVFNLRLNTPVAKATSLFRKRNSEPLTAPSAEARFRACGHDQRTEPVWRLCDRPLETFARSHHQLYGYPTLAGRGGSVSRRDHNPLAGIRADLAWARKSEGTHKPIPSYSSGGGPGEALLLEKRPPPSVLPPRLVVRGCGGECFSIETHSPPQVTPSSLSLRLLRRT